jgi:hypothetical protein
MAAEPLASRLADAAFQRRLALIERAYQQTAAERARADVSARWLGFAEDGRGRASYNGREYVGEVLGGVSIPGGTTVNLRRTPHGNFLAW